MTQFGPPYAPPGEIFDTDGAISCGPMGKYWYAATAGIVLVANDQAERAAPYGWVRTGKTEQAGQLVQVVRK